MDFGAHFGVLCRRHQTFAFDDGRAVDRVDDDLDAVLMSSRRRAGKRAGIVLLGVKYAQSIFQRSIPAFLFRPPFWIFPFFRKRKKESTVLCWGRTLLFQRKVSQVKKKNRLHTMGFATRSALVFLARFARH